VVVPRPQLHPTDSILDAAQGLVLERGLGAATVAAIAESSGAPLGSIYHRFPSVHALLTEMWIRAVRRSQAEFAAAARLDDPLEAAVAAALSIYDFCAANPADAQLLMAFRLEDLSKGDVDQRQAKILERLNEPVAARMVDLARGLYGRPSRALIDQVTLAVFDLPYGAVRGPLLAGQRLSARRRDMLERAVRSALGH
jgi:AcrR family transcriptional regulator